MAAREMLAAAIAAHRAGGEVAGLDATSRLYWRMLLWLRARTGIEPTMAITDRLLTRLRGLSASALAAAVTELEALPTFEPRCLELIGSLTSHETVFMRDPAQMALFAAAALPDVIERARARDRVIRLGSAGCSTGEEAYSIAMLAVEALIDAGEAVEQAGRLELRRPWRVDIVGCDIVPAVLDQARQARYATGDFSSLRGLPPQYFRFLPLEPGCNGAADVRRVRADLRRMVSFDVCNLAESAPGGGEFDALFCRNVLIYFSAEARRFAVAALVAALRPGGWLLLGSTDRPGDDLGLETVWREQAVAYRKPVAP